MLTVALNVVLDKEIVDLFRRDLLRPN